MLAEAEPNVPELRDGADVYRRYVTGMRIGLEQVGAHYAISSIFRSYPEDGELFCFDLHRDSHEVFTSGRGRVALGRARVRSRITEETEEICFAVLHLGDQNLSAAVRRFGEQDADLFNEFSTAVRAAMRRANLPEVIRLIDGVFARPGATGDGVPHVALNPLDPEPGQPATTPGAVEPGIAHRVVIPESHAADPAATAYSLLSLFTDEQERILRTILNRTVGEMEDSLRKIYEDHASLLHFLTESGMSPPPALALAASFALNASLRRAFEADPFDPGTVADLLGQAGYDHVTLDAPTLAFAAGQQMKRAMIRLEAAAAEAHPAAALAALHSARELAESIRTVPFEVVIWQAQNIWNDLLRRTDTTYWPAAWREGFKQLGRSMNIAVDDLVIEEGVAAF